MAKASKFHNLTIGKRLGLGFAVLVMIIFIMGFMGLYGFSRMSSNINHLAQESIPILLALSSLNYQRMIIRADTLEVLLSQYQDDPGDSIRPIIRNRQETWKMVEANWEELLRFSLSSQEERKLLEKLKGEYQAWRDIYVDLDGTMEQLSYPIDPQQQKVLYGNYVQLVQEMIPISDTMGYTFEEITAINRQNTKERVEGDIAQGSIINRVTIFSLVLGVISAVLFAFFITHSVKIPILHGRNLLKEISQGDLTKGIPPSLLLRGDEIGDLGRAMGLMVENLTQQISAIIEVSSNLSSFSREIATSVTQITSGAQETASSLVETTTTIEEVKQTADSTNLMAREVADNSKQGLQVAHAGHQSMEDLTKGMELISEQMTSIANTIMELSQQSQAIGEIISSVDDIAEQSNLLAVNASVEAAKAGEQGKGFTVVAQEIKNLAQQSKQATKQVRGILNDIQRATGAAVMATEEGSKAVDKGVKETKETRETIQALNKRFGETVQSAAQIAAANREQLMGMDQVVEAMEIIKEASNQNVESMKQLELTSTTLQEMGQKLTGLIEQYKL